MMKYVVKGFDLEGRIKDLPTRFRRGGESRFFLGMELAVSKEAVSSGFGLSVLVDAVCTL